MTTWRHFPGAQAASLLARTARAPRRSISSVGLASVAVFVFAISGMAGEVKISFLPPPLEGTISLGIYDRDGKLVRVLRREAELAEFEVAPDALRTTWDGRNDSGVQVPPGKYSAHGFAVGDLHVEQVTGSGSETNKASVKLVANPLSGAKRETVDLVAGLDEDGSFLQTTDGLPLFTVDEEQDIISVSLAQRGDKSLELCQNDGDTTDCFTITGIDQMMMFDAGDFELK